MWKDVYPSGSAITKCRVPVYLNVYDLTPINGYIYWLGLGIFHSGIEAHGAEYAFGAHDYPTSGVFEVDPRHCPGFTFRTSVVLGTTDLSPLEFRSFVEQCADEYYGDTYHLIAKNCNHFTDDLCRRLMGKSIPGWVNRLARIGYACNCLLPEGLQVSAMMDTAEFQDVEEEIVHELGEEKEMVESESDQECVLMTPPNHDTQALLRDSFKEIKGMDVVVNAVLDNVQIPSEVCTSPLPPGVLADEKEPLETATSQHWFGSFDGFWHWPLMEVFIFTDV
jgi:hypothetical protein